MSECLFSLKSHQAAGPDERRWNLRTKQAVSKKRVPTSTQEKLVGLMCEECGKLCKSKAGLVAHYLVHTLESVGFLTDSRIDTQDRGFRLSFPAVQRLSFT
ncbi:hypothetical protein CLF_110720 [Clonorchis sinensis]|uniref:C2H2-type domain-containing protein n=1 Tax=Clonorchis sinensis TaxID=79923 RepID=G7YTT5_CLOSI|nr:hypothetical protein CLF_110720 [Clonorchis sinensis]